jgi:hypothetical protein
LKIRIRTTLPATVIPPAKQVRWDWRKLQVALDDYALRVEFQRQVWNWWINDEALQQAARDDTPQGVEEHWRLLQAGVFEIAETLFTQPRTQKKTMGRPIDT